MKTIKITQGRRAIVDDEDFDRVNSRRWSYHHSGYVVRGKPQVSLHRFIIGARKGEFVDHVNGDKMDNRKSNLRLCTPAQNVQNTKSKRGSLKGLEYRPSRRAWAVRIMASGQRHYVGYFKDKGVAMEARDVALNKLHGEFAKI